MPRQRGSTDASGPPAAEAALDRAVCTLADALAGMLAVLDTSVVVVGGRVGALAGFLDPLERSVHEVAPSRCAADLTIQAAHDDRMAGADGALAISHRHQHHR